MPRFPILLVSLVAITIAGCEKPDLLYCANNPGALDCPKMDAMEPLPPPPCTDDTGCKSPTEPVCEKTSRGNTCVLCTATDHALCKDATPVCVDHACQACTSHSECTLSAVCLASGSCADEGDVAYVDPAGTDTASCTKAMPCTKISSGLATVTAMSTPRPYLKIYGAISEGVTITRDLTVFADPGASLTRGTGGAVLTVSGTAVVEIDDLTITKSHSGFDPGITTGDTTALTLKRVVVSQHRGNGITCGGSALTVSGSTVSGNGLVGISCAKGSLTVSSSSFTKNARGGLIAAAGSFDITNSFLYDNGDDNSDVGGVLLNPMSGTTNRFEFNTVVANHVKDVTPPTAGVYCDLPDFTAPNNIISGNAIHGDVTRPNANTGGRCTYPTSAINTPIADLLFVSADPAKPDYHLTSGSPAIGAATTPTLVTTDIDGNARTAAVNDQGADQFKLPSL